MYNLTDQPSSSEKSLFNRKPSAVQPPGPSPKTEALFIGEDLTAMYCCLNRTQICVMPSNFNFLVFMINLTVGGEAERKKRMTTSCR